MSKKYIWGNAHGKIHIGNHKIEKYNSEMQIGKYKAKNIKRKATGKYTSEKYKSTKQTWKYKSEGTSRQLQNGKYK